MTAPAPTPQPERRRHSTFAARVIAAARRYFGLPERRKPLP